MDNTPVIDESRGFRSPDLDDDADVSENTKDSSAISEDSTCIL